MLDSIATAEAAKGRGIGADLLRYLDDQRLANIHEVPDRSPGFVNIQKQVLSDPERQSILLDALRRPMMAGWQFENGGLAQGNVGNAPTYDDVFNTFLGQTYFAPGKYDPALAMTLNAGGQGSLKSGLDAFIAHGSDNTTNPLDNAVQTGYRTQDLKDLATGFGIDPNSENLEQVLRDKTKDYYGIGGMSSGWNPTGDARQGNMTLYQRQDGKLVPIQTNTGVYPEKGSWLQENPGILAPLGVLTGGLAYGALAGGAAAAGGGAAAAAGTGAGITGTAGASSAAAYGAMPAAWGGFAGSTGLGAAGLGAGYGAGLGVYGGLGAGYLGGSALAGGAGSGGSIFGQAGDWYNSLPKYQQQALRGAGQNFLTSGGDPRAAAQGAISGGLGGFASGTLADMGAPGWLSNLGGRAAGMLGGGLSNAIFGGAAPAGGGSGGSSGAGGAGGGSGGGGSGMAAGAASSIGGSGAAGGLGAGWRMKSATDAANQSYLAQSYAPIALEAQKKKLAEAVADQQGLAGLQ